MEARVVYFDGCPSWRIAAGRLQVALRATGHEETVVELLRVESAVASGFAGSPTLLINGRDLFPSASSATELTCRLYPTPAGLRGSPTLGDLVEALSNLPDVG